MNLQKEFQFLGLNLEGRGIPTEMVDKYAGRKLIIAASAACVWDDLAQLGVDHVNAAGRFNDWHVMCVNDMIMYFPGVIDHCYSNQHRWFQGWLKARRETICKINTRRNWGEAGPTHSCRTGGKYNWPWPGPGTSTLNAVYTGIAMGYNPIVLCGAPLDNSPHFFDPPWADNNFEREVGLDVKGNLRYWHDAAANCFKGRVRSMSGRTKELLGGYP